jgi:hypothetical protein
MMNHKTLSEIINEKFSESLSKKSLDFPKSKIKIISLNKAPLKLRSIILDNDREFHLVINEKKLEIFHDCPTFLIHTEREDKICNHIIRVLTLLDESISVRLISQLDYYNLTSEDFGSKKKSKNFLKLANQCFEDENCVEGLNYLNKAIINQQDSEKIIEIFLQTALANNLYIEFFEFLQNSYENEFSHLLIKFNSYIEKGTTHFLKAIPLYSFYELLRIIESIDSFLERYKFQNISFLTFLIKKLMELTKSKNLNEYYFSFFFIKKYYRKIAQTTPEIGNILKSKKFNAFKTEIVDYFLNEIENFCVIDKLKLMKKQFIEFEIPEYFYLEKYKAYKIEIKELEKKVYLRKFSFIKLLVDKFNLKKTRVGFRKKRNTYLVNHDKDNFENPAYRYIINHLGFYGLNDSIIKSSDIGVNYLIMNELFLDDFSSFPDIFYYKKQFWGENEDYEINPVDFYSVISKSIDYDLDIGQNYSNVNDFILIEWDLANKPRQGSLVNAFGAQIIIPDQNNPLFHDLNPFDLCYCQKTPVKIERNLIKTINVITKCSFKDAIKSVTKGMEFIEGYYPLSLVKSVIKKTLNPFEANRILIGNENKIFIPNYKEFVKKFQEFLFDFINKEREYVYHELESDPKEKTNQFLILLNLSTELAGIELPLEKIIQYVLQQSLNIYQFRRHLLENIHNYIEDLLKKKELGSTIIFDLKKMRHTQFSKYSVEIIKIRKQEFEESSIYKVPVENGFNFDISEVNKTYYGKQLLKILNLSTKSIIRQEIFYKYIKFASKLNLSIKIID